MVKIYNIFDYIESIFFNQILRIKIYFNLLSINKYFIKINCISK
jgi:hypothetical protein